MTTTPLRVRAPLLPLAAAIDEMLSCFEILRSAAFTPNELFFALTQHPDCTVLRLEVRRAGRTHSIDCAVAREPCAAVNAALVQALTKHNNMTPDEGAAWVRDVREKSAIRARTVELFFSLEFAGLRVGRGAMV